MKTFLAACYRARKLIAVMTVCSVPILAGCAAVNVDGYTDDPAKADYVYNDAYSASQSSVSDTSSQYVKYTDKRPQGLILNPAAKATATSYDEAMDYLLAARLTLIKKAQHRETLDTATKVGVDVGVIGAVLKAPTEHSNEPVLNFLTLAGISAKINDDVRPVDVSLVYRAGVTALDCIRSAAIDSHGAIGKAKHELGIVADYGANPAAFDSQFNQANRIVAVRSDIGTVTADIATLKADAADIRRLNANIATTRKLIAEKRNKKYEPQVAADGEITPEIINEAIEAARTRVATVNGKVSTLKTALEKDAAGRRIVDTVNTTIHAVNREAMRQSPDVRSILGSASLFAAMDMSSKFKPGSSTASDASGQPALLQDSSVGTKADSLSRLESKLIGLNDALADARETADADLQKLKGDLDTLDQTASRLPAPPAEPSYDAIAGCRFSAEPSGAIRVDPNTVKLTVKGEPVKVKLNGTKPYGVDWYEGQPAGVVTSFSSDNTALALSASDSAKETSTHFRLFNDAGAKSDPITLVIVKAKAPEVTEQEDSPPPPPSTKDTQPPQDAPAAPPPADS